MTREFIAQQGFMSYAFNSDIDYLKLAYMQAMSIKLTQSANMYAIIVNENTNSLITDKHRRVFDSIIVSKSKHPFDEYWSLFWRTPFKETIYVESDLILTRNIDHWWNAYRLRNICLSSNCKDFLGNTITKSDYRLDSSLPNLYTGMMYFRYSTEAMTFFNIIKDLSTNWGSIKNEPNTPDILFSLASIIYGEDKCTLPSLDFLNFTHLKPRIQKWTEMQSWLDHIPTEDNLPNIRINNMNQYYPVHYYEKGFATDERIENYERALGLT